MSDQMAATETPHGKIVHANELDIYYEEHGTGDPLLLLHGGTLTCRQWDNHIPTFAKHFHVFTLDSRGHGQTNNPTGRLSFRAMADDVAAFIQELHLDMPLMLGFSDGGQIALDLGIRYPALARALVMVGAYSRLTESGMRFMHAFGVEGPHSVNFERMERERPSLVQGWKAQHTVQGSDTWKTLLDQISEMWYAPLGYSEADLRGGIAPTLIAVGDRDGAIPVEEATYLFRLMPNAELAVTPNAGHFFPDITHPLFAQMLDFLLRHQAKPAA
jgi:pimeloyl-ACP methyl ester carboxylesterase